VKINGVDPYLGHIFLLMGKTFLTAAWRKLAIANYAVDTTLLTKYLPNKTELDLWQGTCYVSLVGFMFAGTKLKGLKIPFHTDFEEVNLRFYVKYKTASNDWKRGVVFIKEIVPKPALTFVANTIYNENYETMPMDHTWGIQGDSLVVEYKWKQKNWNSFRVVTGGKLMDIKEGSEEEFITEHYWGYTRVNKQKTSEYGVEHPRWQVYDMKQYAIQADFGSLYGKEFEFLNQATPQSVFLAEGSEIVVKEGIQI
jgi:uncharacterized protein